MHCFPKGTGPFAVDDAYLEYPFLSAGGHIFLQQLFYFPGVKGMQVKDTVYGIYNRLLFSIIGFIIAHSENPLSSWLSGIMTRTRISGLIFIIPKRALKGLMPKSGRWSQKSAMW